MAHVDNRFVFVMPAYNASATIWQSFISIIAQTHRNWRVILRDDLSTDDTVERANAIVTGFGLQDKFEIIRNDVKQWEVKNVLDMIASCDDDDIICRLDADDWLIDLDVLTILNQRYNELGVEAVWTAHRWDFSSVNISRPMYRDADVYAHPWVSSHFKTFRKRLLNNVSDQNFRNSSGEYFKRIGDQAIYLPALHNARGNWHFEPIIAYHYTIDMKPETFETDDARFQRDEAEYLRSRGFIA